MNQNTRNRAMIVMAIVLVPTMIHLMATNIREARRRIRPSSQGQAASLPSPPPIEAARAVLSPASTTPDLDAHVLKEQKRMAAQAPTRNPFSAASFSSNSESPTPKTPILDIPVVAEAPLELNGIVYGKTADRRSAVINGKMLGEGKSIGGYTIVTIGTDEVLLKNGTNQLTLRLKQ